MKESFPKGCRQKEAACKGKPECDSLAQHSGQFEVPMIWGFPGHNGLVAAGYLAKAGKRVCLVERRHVVGGAAVTEEIVPGFKFSRASYVLGLLRPKVYQDLDLAVMYLHLLTRLTAFVSPIDSCARTDFSSNTFLHQISIRVVLSAREH